MMRNSLRHNPLPGFFLLAFGISWGGIGIILATRNAGLSPLQPLEGGLILLAMLLGPSVGGLMLTVLLNGRAGIGALGSRLLRWRAGVGWYAVALLTIPLTLLTIMFLLGALVDPAFAPRFQWPLLAVGVLAGSFEEIGWTGFAAPRLLARHGPGRAGLLLGVIWAFWHLLADFRYNFGAMGFVWPLEFVIVYLATLTPYRILMTWVYSRTQSLLLAMLMHASFTGWLLVLFPRTSPSQSLAWQTLFALSLWGMAAAVMGGDTAKIGKAAPAPRRGAIERRTGVQS